LKVGGVRPSAVARLYGHGSKPSEFSMRTPTLALLVLAAALSAVDSSPAQTFTVIGIPDTQNYSEFYPAIFQQHTQWVADNIESLNVRYVSHYGDLVNNGSSLAEWAVADAAMATIDATGVPCGVTAGNHDVTPSGTPGTSYIPQNYLAYFGAQRYDGRRWYRGTSPSGMSSYQVFSAHGVQFLTLHVECDAALRELEWAQGVLDRNRDKAVLFTTHRYLQDAEDYTGGVPLVPSGRYPDIWYAAEGLYVPDGIRSEDLFDWFVRRNPNIFLVQCGHFHEEYRQTSTNVAGLPVHEVLADYQDDPNGGDGWLRIMTFDLGANRIDFDSYSTFLDTYRTATESAFSLNVDFPSYRSLAPTVVLQQGIDGYSGCQDTWIDEDRPNTSFGGSSVLVVDDDTTNNLFNDRRGQALLRFDGLVGDPGVGRIPFGALVVSAHLSFDITDDIDQPFSDPDFFLHRVLVPWDESSTWNSLGSGLGGSELTQPIAIVEGDNDPNGEELRRIDVTAVVQAWVNGDPNHGFAILPEIIGGNDDGIEIPSSESGNKLRRPRLEVVYASTCGYTQYDVGIGAANTLELAGLALPRVGGWIDVVTTPADFPVATYVSLAPADVPILGGRLLIDLGLAVVADLTLDGETSIAVPDLPALAGAELYLQSFAFQPGAPNGIALSNGLRAELCR
jgi:hypothetical protein